MADHDDGHSESYKYSVRPETDAVYDTATKYATNTEVRWRQQGNPRITYHCEQRWDQRTPAGSVSPETAWCHAVGIPPVFAAVFATTSGETPSELRVYRGCVDGEGFGVVFVVCGDTQNEETPAYHVRTVYDTALIEDMRVRAFVAYAEWECCRMHHASDGAGVPADPVFDARVLPSGFVASLS